MVYYLFLIVFVWNHEASLDCDIGRVLVVGFGVFGCLRVLRCFGLRVYDLLKFCGCVDYFGFLLWLLNLCFVFLVLPCDWRLVRCCLLSIVMGWLMPLDFGLAGFTV